MNLETRLLSMTRIDKEFLWLGSWMLCGQAGPLTVYHNDFMDDRLSMLWALLENLDFAVIDSQKHVVDPWILIPEMKKTDLYERIGGAVFLVRLTSRADFECIHNMVQYAEMIFGVPGDYFSGER